MILDTCTATFGTAHGYTRAGRIGHTLITEQSAQFVFFPHQVGNNHDYGKWGWGVDPTDLLTIGGMFEIESDELYNGSLRLNCPILIISIVFAF
jgi:hypothetical protein